MAARHLLLGREHPQLGEIRVEAVGPGVGAIGISAGSDSVVLERKSGDDPKRVNEDAVLAIDDGDRVMLAVADAHFGAWSSHVLLEFVAELSDALPESLDGALSSLQRACIERNRVRTPSSHSGLTSPRSETTFLWLLLDRESGDGHGISFGDSSAFLLSASEAPTRLNPKTQCYVTPRHPESLHPARAERFTFHAPPDSLLLAFTDGVDECHYGRPRTSITPRDLSEIVRPLDAPPEELVRALVEHALHGVRGNPGGQDNVSVAVTRSGPRVAPVPAD